ncbi:MAG TPA: prephenate dehydratase [Pseudonocardiaceae bacterium]
MLSIAYLGPKGTFTEQAARTLPEADGALLMPEDGVPAAVDAVRAGRADAACVPVENSVEGSVTSTLDALADPDADPLVAVRETVLPVRFSVLVRPGTAAGEVRTVATHPHAAAQVRGWLGEHLPGAKLVTTYSTAAAAVAVCEGDADAAVTAPVAAEHYPLDALATEVADLPDAVTRFLLLRKPLPPPPPTGSDRTSLIAVTADRTGALLEVLAEFAARGINLSRIESRPTKGRLGEYQFFLDCDGHVSDRRVAETLAALHRRCTRVRFLGSYPRAGGPRTPVPHDATDAGFEAGVAWVDGLLRGRP